jgi:hypothetical protein
MAKESFHQGPVMPLTPHLQGAGLDQEATRVAKVAFEIARIALGTPHPNDPVIDAMAKRTVELVNPYRAKAYRRAAESLGALTVPLDQLIREGTAHRDSRRR